MFSILSLSLCILCTRNEATIIIKERSLQCQSDCVCVCLLRNKEWWAYLEMNSKYEMIAHILTSSNNLSHLNVCKIITMTTQECGDDRKTLITQVWYLSKTKFVCPLIMHALYYIVAIKKDRQSLFECLSKLVRQWFRDKQSMPKSSSIGAWVWSDFLTSAEWFFNPFVLLVPPVDLVIFGFVIFFVVQKERREGGRPILWMHCK